MRRVSVWPWNARITMKLSRTDTRQWVGEFTHNGTDYHFIRPEQWDVVEAAASYLQTEGFTGRLRVIERAP